MKRLVVFLSAALDPLLLKKGIQLRKALIYMGSIIVNIFTVVIFQRRICFCILLSSCFIYSLSPFLNGSGCDFYAEGDDEYRTINITCFAGGVTSVYRRKTTGDIIITKGLWGKMGNNIYLVNYRSESYPGPYNLRGDFLRSFVKPAFISSYKIFTSAVDGTDVVVSAIPIDTMRAFKLERTGPLSWF